VRPNAAVGTAPGRAPYRPLLTVGWRVRATSREAPPGPQVTARTLSEFPAHVRVVDSFADLLAVPFEGTCNAICWRRELTGDFDELVRRLPAGEGITTIDEAGLEALPVGAAGAAAVATLLADLRGLREAGHTPELNCIDQYLRDPDELLPTDVHSFHVDSATVPTDTFLCCYAGAASEALGNTEAERCVDIPHLRAALLARFGGQDDEDFAAYLRERHFDLHYRPLAHARPLSLGIGHLWRLAVRYPGSPVPACIHRAPQTRPGDPRRLLLIS
jgi:hypothetical protein